MSFIDFCESIYPTYVEVAIAAAFLVTNFFTKKDKYLLCSAVFAIPSMIWFVSGFVGSDFEYAIYYFGLSIYYIFLMMIIINCNYRVFAKCVFAFILLCVIFALITTAAHLSVIDTDFDVMSVTFVVGFWIMDGILIKMTIDDRFTKFTSNRLRIT